MRSSSETGCHCRIRLFFEYIYLNSFSHLTLKIPEKFFQIMTGTTCQSPKWQSNILKLHFVFQNFLESSKFSFHLIVISHICKVNKVHTSFIFFLFIYLKYMYLYMYFFILLFFPLYFSVCLHIYTNGKHMKVIYIFFPRYFLALYYTSRATQGPMQG